MSILKIIFAFAVIAAIVYVLFPNAFSQIASIFFAPESGWQSVRIGNEIFNLEVAATDDKRIKGLSGRDGMPGDQGMIFVFDDAGSHGITMQGMRFDLDIIWARNKQIVDIVENAKPSMALEQKVYYPISDADTVIELNTGTVERLNLNQGDRLSW